MRADNRALLWLLFLLAPAPSCAHAQVNGGTETNPNRIDVVRFFDEFERAILAKDWTFIRSSFLPDATVRYGGRLEEEKTYSVDAWIASLKMTAGSIGYTRSMMISETEDLGPGKGMMVRSQLVEHAIVGREVQQWNTAELMVVVSYGEGLKIAGLGLWITDERKEE
jgi:hypothetical protein